jgi:phosphatidylglycerophosphate synthase
MRTTGGGHTYTLDEVLASRKPRDSWWTVLLIDPPACRLVCWLANRTPITPSQLTGLAFVLGVAAAGCFAQGGRVSLAAGAVLFSLSFLLDCMDGKLARLTGTGSVFGMWLDFVLDQIRFLACAAALLFGQFALTGQVAFLYLAVLVVFTDLFRYVNSSQMSKVRTAMRPAEPEAHEAHEARAAEAASTAAAAPGVESAFNRRFHARFPWYRGWRDLLLRYRIRTHLFSGIEFQMAVCVVAPLTGFVVAVPLAAAALLLLFEGALVYKLWLSTREFRDLVPRTAVADEPSPAIPWAVDHR